MNLHGLYNVLDIVVTIAVIVIPIITFFCKEKIKLIFQKNVIKTQESYKIELESYKNKLLHELELYKLDIDVQRNLTIEVLNKRLIVYQKTISNFVRFQRLILQYNSSPSVTKMHDIFGANATNAWDHLEFMEENMLFYSDNIGRHLKLIVPNMDNILKILEKGQKIEINLLEKFISSIKELKKNMISELFKEKPNKAFLDA